MPGQAVFGGGMLFNFTSIIDFHIVTARKQGKADIDNVRKISRQVMHDYAVGDLAYVEKTGIYHKSDNNKQGPYIITEVFTNGTTRVQTGAINEKINIRRMVPHFEIVELVP